jgi:ribosomal protein L7/L12
MDIPATLYLMDMGPNRLEVLAFLRSYLELSLKEVKEKSSNLPMEIDTGSISYISFLYTKLQSLGAKVEIR